MPQPTVSPADARSTRCGRRGSDCLALAAEREIRNGAQGPRARQRLELLGELLVEALDARRVRVGAFGQVRLEGEALLGREAEIDAHQCVQAAER